jgi:hypothetical protein
MDRKKIHPLGLNQRIAIVGAGATGLTAAETLKHLGYKYVSLFEREDHVGGKCLSIEIDSKSYELGAGILTKNNEVPLRLANKYGIPIERVVYGKNIFVDHDGKPKPKPSIALQLKVFWQLLFRYRRLLKKYKEVASPGFLDLDPAITVPFKQFAKENKIVELASVFNLFLTGFGYCYTDHVPTAYVLKYANWQTIMAYLLRQAYIFPNGIQNLWARIAAEHDIRYNTRILSISRRNNVISIETADRNENFDSLILTSPLDELEYYLDIEEDEKLLLRKINTLDYQTILCTLEDFPQAGGFISANFSREQSGHPVFWYYRQPNSAIYSFYVLADRTISHELVLNNIRELVHKMGGRIKEVHKFIDWKYFPHIDGETMRDGFYEKINQMQGERNTFYIGELLNFSCIGFTTQYTEELIKCYF